MINNQVMVITGTRKGIGRHLAHYYTAKGFQVMGCSRKGVDYQLDNYRHFCLDVTDESRVKEMFTEIRKTYQRMDILINNAGIAAMNHVLLTPLGTVQKVLGTNVTGTFLFCREAAKLMKKNLYGRIVNFTTVAVPLKLAGEAIYAASKAAVISLTQVMARELADFNITVNSVGPTAITTDLIRSVSEEKIQALVEQQAIRRLGEMDDITNVIDFFINPNSNFVTGQVIFLGGV
jgi:3-oxoacyl-[acyl-carrier protein] reductase